MPDPEPAGSDPTQRNLAGTLGLLFGLLGLALMALIPPLGLLSSLAAACLGLVGRARIRRGGASNPGQATVGLLCGAVGLVVSCTLVANEAVYLADHPALVHSLTTCARHASTSTARNACVQRLTKAIEGRP